MCHFDGHQSLGQPVREARARLQRPIAMRRLFADSAAFEHRVNSLYNNIQQKVPAVSIELVRELARPASEGARGDDASDVVATDVH